MARGAKASRRQAGAAAAAGRDALARGRYAEAVYHLGEAADAAPRDASLRHALARAHAHNGQPAEAIERATEALGLDPRAHDAARLLSGLLLEYQLTDHGGVDPRGLRAAMAFDDVDRAPIARAALALLAERPALAELHAQGASDGWPAAADALLADPRGLIADPLFHAALAAAPLAEPETEFLLAAARARLLAAGREGPLDRPRSALAVTLVAQGLLNEYVWVAGAEERAALAGLAPDPAAVAAGDADACRALMLAVLYQPPERLLDPATEPRAIAAVRPQALRHLLQSRFAALRAEAALAAGIESLGAADDAVSTAVREQYEDNPYPRWTSTLLPERGSLRTALAEHFPAGALALFDRPFRVLVAGCGTGQQLVHAAAGYGDNARVTGIDLSRASLAYALRMAEQFGLDNVAVEQGDILALAGTMARWDVIEAVGVLHHMADPLRGWAILAEALEPGGVMYTGLYSAVARRPVQEVRDRLRAEGAGDGADAIRAVRRRMIEAPAGSPERELARSADFNTLSNVRDLLFHRHEAPVTIEAIAGFLDAHGLAFHGFDLRPHVADAFVRRFGAAADPRDLARWAEFEAENPATFEGMFLFWCRKPA